MVVGGRGSRGGKWLIGGSPVARKRHHGRSGKRIRLSEHIMHARATGAMRDVIGSDGGRARRIAGDGALETSLRAIERDANEMRVTPGVVG